jgi:hypothetical protein
MYLRDPDWTQTNDLLLRRQLLYSTELPGLLTGREDNFFWLAAKLKLKDKWA